MDHQFEGSVSGGQVALVSGPQEGLGVSNDTDPKHQTAGGQATENAVLANLGSNFPEFYLFFAFSNLQDFLSESLQDRLEELEQLYDTQVLGKKKLTDDQRRQEREHYKEFLRSLAEKSAASIRDSLRQLGVAVTEEEIIKKAEQLRGDPDITTKALGYDLEIHFLQQQVSSFDKLLARLNPAIQQLEGDTSRTGEDDQLLKKYKEQKSELEAQKSEKEKKLENLKKEREQVKDDQGQQVPDQLVKGAQEIVLAAKRAMGEQLTDEQKNAILAQAINNPLSAASEAFLNVISEIQETQNNPDGQEKAQKIAESFIESLGITDNNIKENIMKILTLPMPKEVKDKIDQLTNEINSYDQNQQRRAETKQKLQNVGMYALGALAVLAIIIWMSSQDKGR